jgi:hypothetical protein
MDVFDLRNRLVEDYARYTRSFIKIADQRICQKVDGALADGALWPEPLLQLNPTFASGGNIDDLVDNGTLHRECSKIFRIDKTDSDPTGKQLPLYKHQTESIYKAKEGGGKSYVLTSGTGSGKSLAYIIPIVDHVLTRGSGKGIQAIVVYPMNALANSQNEELGKFLKKGYSEGKEPVRFARYTGQEETQEKEYIRNNPPDILLTNYMMLELLLTRKEDQKLVKSALGLRFLIFDELHTYRGRQGADIALLIRRCRLAFGGHEIICIGTSATMTTGGSSLDQKREVAVVAQTLFGTPFDMNQVITETLERATPEIDFSKLDVSKNLSQTIGSNVPTPKEYLSFRAHPLSSWIESTFGIRTETETARLIRQLPRKLRGKSSAAEELALLTSTDEEKCYGILRDFLIRGSELRLNDSTRFPIFAFRLHQFFTRGDTVWSTMEQEGSRHLEMAKLGSKPGDPTKPLFPLVFCRRCGTAYYRVTIIKDGHGFLLIPRDDHREDVQEDGIDGYLYLSEKSPWPKGEGDELLKRLPEFMKDTNPDGSEKIRSEERSNLPEPIFINPAGRLVAEGIGIPAALIRRNFLFCLEPSCGIAYTKTQRSEKTKLGTLGVDNRSTATTVLAVRSLIELQSDTSLKPEARKLLSFTDNRQDASLQAGHFNDFAQVALLRSALYKAAQTRGATGLSHGELSRTVFDALSLRFEDYAADSEVRGPARDATHDALRRVIDYYIYRDLQRGWRVTAPNLEDCGLIQFDYQGLVGTEGVLGEKELWERGFNIKIDRDTDMFVETPVVLQNCPMEKREEIFRTFLDMLRRALAVKVDILDQQRQRDLVEQTNPRLLEGTVWYLDDPNELVKSVVAYPRAKRQGDTYGLFVSSYGILGHYLRRSLLSCVPKGGNLGRDEIDNVIHFLFRALKRYGIVEQVRSGDTPGYQINHDALRWIAGSGEIRPIDRTRLLEDSEIPPEVNAYFVECYRHFIDLKCVLEAREHTAQVASKDRQEREDRFKTAELPLLFCSPTMELGVDIAQLNVVNLRNVPPTPANYAQRSGRAGRGGQPALVFTYCAGRSPHDQYYYHQPGQMVGGSVAPPRIDLKNRDLVRSHIHAIWMEVAKPDLGKTLTSVLDIIHQDGKIQLTIKDILKKALINRTLRAEALVKSNSLISSIGTDLSGANWFHEKWVSEVLDQIELSFDEACNRWRELYRAALRQRELHHRIILDLTRPDAERNHSRRLRAQAESQIRLLTEAEGIYEGDFYSYRYFAAEGFLPGYNFPRLPLSAFVPARRKRNAKDEFVSRPRFLAISEFGPRALIYHEGARYRVYKVNLDFGSEDIEATHSLVTATMKRCSKCGYAHLEQEKNLAEVCDRCGQALDDSTVIQDLIQMQNVSLKLAQRITCDEEERLRYGYNLKIAYRFPEVGGKLDRKDADVFVDGKIIMRLSYGDAASLYKVNLGWANQKNQPMGFLLDLERGYWARNPADQDDPEDASAGRQMRVVPYVVDTKNALVIRFETVPSPAEIASLQAAFKEAILRQFQLEPRELSCSAMPSPKDRREILFYEASEGGAGVLRQLVEDPKAVPALARRAIEICHFDPDTLDDKAAKTCGKACYECLLDYTNQPDHQILDRNIIKGVLTELARSESKPAGGTGSRAERMNALRKKCDSKLEISWLDRLDALILRPPSDAQYLIEACSTKPDFFYKEYNAAIYIDGPPHDEPSQIRDDEKITRCLKETGYVVIRFHHKADWIDIFKRHPDIFGAPRI